MNRVTLYYVTCDDTGIVFVSMDYEAVCQRRDQIAALGTCTSAHTVRTKEVTFS